MAISIYKVSKEIQEKVMEAYKNNVSMRQIEQDFEVTRGTVSKFLEEKGIKTTKGNHYRKYNHNEDFFETIDTEEKAYWLGFMYADGWIQNNENRHGQDHFGISLSTTDRDHLQKFLNSLNATNPIRDYKDGMSKVELTSQKTVNDLIKHGCFKQKTFILEPPKTVPENFLSHFIRGFFDGDGSIIKSGGKFYEQYHRYRFSVSFSCMENIGRWLKDYFGFGSVIKDNRKVASYSYTIGGNEVLEEFYHKLYDNANIYMDRKYERFQEFLQQKYGESQGINARRRWLYIFEPLLSLHARLYRQ